MGIVFFCQSCGSRFEVDSRMAGKRGRCHRCGQQMVIPRAEEIASMSALPVLATAGGPPRRPGPTARAAPALADSPASSLGDWLKTGISQVGLAPLSAERLRPAPLLPSALEDGQDSRPYSLAAPLVDNRGPVRFQENLAVRLWRREIGGFQKVFRWFHESAYFVSIPFLMILLFATAIKNRPLALLGATVVVLLNLGRLAAGVANLVLVPLRDGLSIRKYKKPIRRVVEPILTIALVVLAFTFIPWLSGSRPAPGTLADRLRSGATGLEKEIEGETRELLGKAKQIDVKQLGDEAGRKLRSFAPDPKDQPPDAPPGGPPP